MYTNIGLCSLTSGVVLSFQPSITFIDKQQWIQNARINHNLLYVSTQSAHTGKIIMQQNAETRKLNAINNCQHRTEATSAPRKKTEEKPT